MYFLDSTYGPKPYNFPFKFKLIIKLFNEVSIF